MDTNEKNSTQKEAKDGLKAAQKAVIAAEAKMNALKYAVYFAHARQLAALKMRKLGEAEAKWFDDFLTANNGAVLANDDDLEVMSRGMLSEALINYGAQLEIETMNQREKASVGFNDALKVFERAKEALALHQTKSNPLPPKQPTRI